ncbi:MAG: hypothetical protein HQL47_00865 [Gammaproteobacteria bacterium]|nr:hypothetical protein [Gammaproteobacteria bacterium]
MKAVHLIASSILLAAFFAVITGCSEPGPAEKAGERIDNAVEKAGIQIEQAGDNLRDGIQQER